MSFITNLLKTKRKRKGAQVKPFFELSSKEKKEIIVKSARQANQDQRDLIERYQKICSQRS